MDDVLAQEDTELVRLLGRDVTLLVEDHDRARRQCALIRVKSVLVDSRQSQSEASRCSFFEKYLQSALLSVVENDNAEKCRELALQILHSLLQDQALHLNAGTLASFAAAFLPLARKRLESVPGFAELSEEIRLLMVRTITALLDHDVSWSAITLSPHKVAKDTPLFADLAAIMAR